MSLNRAYFKHKIIWYIILKLKKWLLTLKKKIGFNIAYIDILL